jgi:hypothetical protein
VLVALYVNSRSLSRALWYGELTSALREAERLLSVLERDGIAPAEFSRLCLRIAAVRSEVETLNQSRPSDDRIVGDPWNEVGRST